MRAIAAFVGGAGAAACGSTPSSRAVDGAISSDPPDAGGPADVVPIDARIDVRIDATEAPACSASTLTPSELLADIDTFVVLCMENRSFDHYLGSLSLLEGRSEIDGLAGDEVNIARDGAAVPSHLLEDLTPPDPPHGWTASHNQWNGGANNGFVEAHAGSAETDVMGYYVRTQLPQLYALADQSVICDRWFCSVLGPTWPNRYFLHGASSDGLKSNVPRIGFRNIFQLLDAAGVSNRNYYHDTPWATGAYQKVNGNATIETFFDDAEAGNLPQYALIDPQFFGNGANDDHPSHDVRNGQVLIASIISALAQSPQWNRCLFALTYDEHGGFFDHVSPPTTVDQRSDFERLGFRVPSLVVGPTVRRGCVNSTVLEHVSVLSTLTTRFDLEPMNDRVVATADLSSCIDESLLGNPQPAPVLPPIEMSRTFWKTRPPLPGGNKEIAHVLDANPAPAYLDRRGDADGITERVLAHAERLGAVTFSD